MNNFLNLIIPQALIARYPLASRDRSKLLVSKDNHLYEHIFRELPDFLSSGDLIIFNNTQVTPVRLYATRPTGGKVELLLTEQISAYEGWAIYRSSHKLLSGHTLKIDAASVRITDKKEQKVLIKSDLPLAHLQVKSGHIPLPPYLRRDDNSFDKQAYQSHLAAIPGSCAAPTASLHFTSKVLSDLQSKGIQIAYCTLHVGLGTFLPIKGTPDNHLMHSERYEVPDATARAIRETKERGNKVIAVGTTVVRAIESAYHFQKFEGNTQIFIRENFKFQVIDKLITNFHQPDSTLILLVQAFAGINTIQNIYKHAIRESYRFYSYGDAMLLERKS